MKKIIRFAILILMLFIPVNSYAYNEPVDSTSTFDVTIILICILLVLTVALGCLITTILINKRGKK